MKKKQFKKVKVSRKKINTCLHRINAEINNLLKNLRRYTPTNVSSKNLPLFSKKILENMKDEGLCQNIFFLQDSISKETVDKRIGLAAESIANWVFMTFGIQKKYIEGEVLQINKTDIDKFVIPGLLTEDLPSVISLRITQPGFKSKDFEIAKPLAEILK